MSAKLKLNDEVIVITGKDKGKTGKITKILPKQSRAIVSGVNLLTKHKKPTQEDSGGIIKKEGTIHLSNLSLIDPKDGKATKVKFENKDNKKVRISKKSDSIIE